ncbi:MAG: family 31 glycosyl hydrolase, alpha-glucosidase [Clostridia bacterium]|jgi:alpha-glucosidase|nr:family 31 glycosyl hydrolase, alpha-glucosidase [Clostridia bacterium]
MELIFNQDNFELRRDNQLILKHTLTEPCIYLGYGEEKIEMYRGNFDIKDEIIERMPLRRFKVIEDQKDYRVEFYEGVEEAVAFTLLITEEKGRIVLSGKAEGKRCNRIWLRLSADKDECVYGGGEQFTYFNLRGKYFPIFTSEQGVGRNKSTHTTFLADIHDKAGGDYYWTFFPQATFVSSRKYYCHIDEFCYMALDFRHELYHEMHLWSDSFRMVLETGDNYIELLDKLTDLLGKQPMLPDWTYKGAWLGIQGGTDICEKKLNKMLEQGSDITGIWAQDWEGIRMTSFGKRLMWNWKWNEKLYPNLEAKMREWKAKGVRFMGYINPYVAIEGDLFEEAQKNGYLVKNQDDEDYLVDFGEFYCGIVDFTNPAACTWYKSVIKTYMLDFGLEGWMADFGEYLPTDCKLFSGEDAMVMHNKWPALWAQINYEALEENGDLGKKIYYMRAGAAGSQKYSTLMWAGDQNVDWSLDDGLASVMTAALSAGMSGHGLHTSDIGGYTTLFDMKRTKELFMRWAEFCAFTPVMRTHEGNRPDDNWQFDSDEETIKHFAWCTRIHTSLYDYLKAVIEENCKKGTPVMRPLFLHYEAEKETYNLQYEYLLGRDLLVAPVYNKGEITRTLYLPQDEWVYLWDGSAYEGGEVTVTAPIGKPPVFYRKGSNFRGLFTKLENAHYDI